MDDTKQDGGPAFPYSALEPDRETRQLVGSIYADNRGMTLRDYFAAKALAALISEPPWGEGIGSPALVNTIITGPQDLIEDRYASVAYAMADAMLRARSKT